MDNNERVRAERRLIERAMAFAAIPSNMDLVGAIVNQMNASSYQSLATASDEKVMFRTQGGIAALNDLICYFQTAQQAFDTLLQEELIQGNSGDNPSGPPQL